MRVFLAVAREGSLTAAGQRLRLDAATVGRRISRLEYEMGTTLFVKSPQGYTPTEAGQALTGPAEAAEAAMTAANSSVTGAHELSGTIRIGAPDGCANFLLPQVCARMVEANPGLEVQIMALPRVADLARREADIAIAVSPPKTGRVQVDKLADYRLSLAASEAWVAAHGLPADLAALQSARMIGYIPEILFDSELDYLTGLGLSRVALASNSVAVQFNWVRSGAGIAVVHEFALPTAPELGRILKDQLSLTRTYWMLRPADTTKDARLSRFAALLAVETQAELGRLQTKIRDFC